MNSIPELIEDIREGKMVILVDDENRENEGDLIFSASAVTPEKINFLAKEARGLICLSITSQRAETLGLSLMVPEDQNATPNKTAFTVSIEAAEGIHTGISVFDRSRTIEVASAENVKKEDIISPGHVFPIIGKDGGVLERDGHTEASIELSQLAGMGDSAVICEIMNEDGSMARLDDLKKFSEKHGIKLGSIEELIAFKREQ